MGIDDAEVGAGRGGGWVCGWWFACEGFEEWRKWWLGREGCECWSVIYLFWGSYY